MSMKFEMHISIKISRNSAFSMLRKAYNAIFPAHKCKMPTIVGILTFMSRYEQNFFYAQLSMKTIYNLGALIQRNDVELQ